MVDHPCRAIKREFGNVKASFRGLAKDTAQWLTLFTLTNPWKRIVDCYKEP